MKAFNLQDALNGKPVVRRDGKAVSRDQLISIPSHNNPYCRLLVIDSMGFTYLNEQGRQFQTPFDYDGDLFMETTYRSGFLNIYKNPNGTLYCSDRIYSSRLEAEAAPNLSDTKQLKQKIAVPFIAYID
jgi:hypothetical protein